MTFGESGGMDVIHVDVSNTNPSSLEALAKRRFAAEDFKHLKYAAAVPDTVQTGSKLLVRLSSSKQTLHHTLSELCSPMRDRKGIKNRANYLRKKPQGGPHLVRRHPGYTCI